jgi:hypothetical protein
LIPRYGIDVELLEFLFCPWGFSQEGETGIHGWVEFKAADIDPIGQSIPSVNVDEVA